MTQTRYLLQSLGLQTALLPVQINPQGNLDPSKFIKTHQNTLISPGFEALSLVDLFFKGLNPVKSFRFAMPSFCCHNFLQEGLVFNDYVSLGHEAPSAASVVLDSYLVVIVVEIDTKVNWFNRLQFETHILDTTWTCYADSRLVCARVCVITHSKHVPQFSISESSGSYTNFSAFSAFKIRDPLCHLPLPRTHTDTQPKPHQKTNAAGLLDN